MITRAGLFLVLSLSLVASGSSICPDAGDRPTVGNYRAKTSLSGTAWMNGRTGEYWNVYGDIGYGQTGQYTVTAGWSRFDLRAIPDDATVNKVRLLIHEYSELSNGNVVVKLIPDALAGAQALFNSIYNGLAVSDPYPCPSGWSSIPLNDTACAAVESCLVQGHIDMGLSAQFPLVGSSYGYTAPSDLKAYLLVSFSSTAEFCDVSALSGYLATFPCRVGEAETVSFRVSCEGESSPGSVTAYLDINGTHADSQVVDAIHPGDTIEAILAFRAPPQEGKLSLSCYTTVLNDSFRNNDTAYSNCWCFPAYASAAVDFEPEHCPDFPPQGWAVSDSGGAYWVLTHAMDPYAHSGRNYAFCRFGSSPDNWLISSLLYVSPSTADTVGFFLRSHGTTQDSVEVWALSEQDPSARLGLLLDTALDSSWREFRLSLDHLDSQPVYVGIRRFLDDGPGIRVDDVWFSCPMQGAVAETPMAQAGVGHYAVVPNLTSGPMVWFEYRVDREADIRVAILDVAGRCRMMTSAKPSQITGRIPVDVAGLPSGVYLVRAACGTHTQTLRLVLQR